MSNNNLKKPPGRNPAEGGTGDSKNPPPPKPPAGPSVPAPKPVTPPLFRKIDWVTFGITTLLVFIGYLLTLAPDLTLEDCGELAVGSFYAGVPHPPGYPIWTIYTWLFTEFLPISNIAFRVAVSSAVAGALGCGLIALMVSRGSSMMIEGIAELKTIERRWENALCVVAGLVAGMLLGFNGFMWSQAVIVEVYPLSVLSLSGVLVCMMRWVYAPHQRRYLFLAFFFYGICFNNHQTLLVLAMGLEVGIMMVQPRLGRELFFWNVIIYIGGLIGKQMGFVSVLNDNLPLIFIYHAIGIGSAVAWIVLAVKTKLRGIEIARDLAMIVCLIYAVVLFAHITTYVTFFRYPGNITRLRTGWFLLFNLAGISSIATFIYLIKEAKSPAREWVSALICGGAWAIGAAFYVFMPLTSMSNPPMNWGYPRTVTGFFHAFTRGQYERIHPTRDPITYAKQFYFTLIDGTLQEFNLIYLAVGVIVFFFYRRMQARERAWIVGLSALYVCLGPFLLDLLSPAPDRQSQDLNKVFFTASHVMISMFIGYGLTITGSLLVTNYNRWRKPALLALAISTAFALIWATYTYYGTANPLHRETAYFGLALAAFATGAIWFARARAPMAALVFAMALMPVYSIMSHWEDNEQRGHLFGYWFGHDMFTPPFKDTNGKPIYPEMDRDTVLFGGTDPGRFNPTYMIFCESFIPPDKKPKDPAFDRRDVYLITQNALADGTYLNYIRAHYNRVTQPDPPFFTELLRGPKELEQTEYTNIIARLAAPIDRFFLKNGDNIEKRRRAGTSFFKESDFLDLPGFAGKLKKCEDPVSKFLYDNLSKGTQALLGQGGDQAALRRALAKDLNHFFDKEVDDYQLFAMKSNEKLGLERQLSDKQTPPTGADLAAKQAQKEALEKEIAELSKSTPFYTPERFKGITLSDHANRYIKEEPVSHTRIRWSRLLVESAYPTEIAKSIGGVYPDLEIHTPSNEDSQKCFQEYLGDAQRRLDHDRRAPNEPRQIKPGEDVRVVDNRVQVSGQVAVMAINGLLTKIIFDKNPGHEFYVEESFPLDWMYPHLTPYGIIMKINRQPLAELSDEICRKDHEFWSQFQQRLIGTNVITYDTSISNICAFAEKIYHRRDYTGFKGDPKFIRDNDGQKAFSKLRSSIAGVYAWRLSEATSKMQEIQRKPPAEQQALAGEMQRLSAAQQRMLKEAEFSFKQAYAFCPYSPEAVFRYINLLIGMGRVEDARLMAVTSLKLDPNNGQMEGLVNELDRMKQAQGNMPPQFQPPAPAAALNAEIPELEKQVAANPKNLQAASKLLSSYAQLQQTQKALDLVDKLLADSQTDSNALMFIASVCNQMNQLSRVEKALAAFVKIAPETPEGWFDLAGVQALNGQPPAAVESLRNSLRLSAKRLAKSSNAMNLYSTATNDPRFAALRQTPDFQKLMAEFKPPGQ